MKLLVYTVSAFYLLYGLVFAASPSGMFLLINDAELTTNTALVDVRATYGGLTLAVGIAIAYLGITNRLSEALVVSAVMLFGMAIARAFGLFVDGPSNWLMYLYLALEIIGGGLALVLMRYAPEDGNDA
ncbi:MAG: DUF4345 domain-containing protein [Pseudomonadota bacterium]